LHIDDVREGHGANQSRFDDAYMNDGYMLNAPGDESDSCTGQRPAEWQLTYDPAHRFIPIENDPI
jgi:hypothetical protein